MTGAELIAAERQRQIDKEGWSSAHDDKYTDGTLRKAAVIYAQYGDDPRFQNNSPMGWPWDNEWWKPCHDTIRCLVKAGALIAAEIDRLQRKGT